MNSNNMNSKPENIVFFFFRIGKDVWLFMLLFDFKCNFRSRPQYFDHFNKDVVLLPNPSWGLVCKQGSKLRLHKHGHILSAFEFQKAWDYKTVVEQIRAGFGERIPEDVR